ncbi:UDP-2,3-diacylglucosamine hydrolase [Pasteurella multocida]|nr:UDP-2,3-diacylglucosamine hydrolase [Pasteurella multocida]
MVSLFLLCHGDTLCIDDVPYQQYRKKSASKMAPVAISTSSTKSAVKDRRENSSTQ